MTWKNNSRVRQRDQLPRCGDRPVADSRVEIKLKWREGAKAPCKMSAVCDAVVGRGVVYYKVDLSDLDNDEIHAYHTTTPTSSLSQLSLWEKDRILQPHHCEPWKLVSSVYIAFCRASLCNIYTYTFLLVTLCTEISYSGYFSWGENFRGCCDYR